jgi:hypothetical protein
MLHRGGRTMKKAARWRPKSLFSLERETRFELATPTLAS